ncbi:hypothetical protein BDQ12DRAFT_682001 [Crucibulum laeve]|uniref:VPS9 domain-containing protein n=1 Tax=Crucibulum laeve TaxID=68775 RepID=A0A5C3M404_9AGAR|nr:hypothetical protein BDQ12DRAFT_682001 [Crucibulum laeve]
MSKLDPKREQFPATSIGRSQGARLQQTASHEAHPLLSGSTSPSSPGQESNPKYLPYTPRQRLAPTSATTTTVHLSSPQQHQGDATSKLQLMNLKAAAQNVGLDTGTVGWTILEKLVVEIEHGEEWSDIWNAITSGKATLLLPLEQCSTHDKITPDFIKDHVVLCDGPSRKNVQLITLSGLRGSLDDETLTFRSTLHPSSKLFSDLLSPITRTAGLSLLPPLPGPLSDMEALIYPHFTLPSYAPSLPLPPRLHISSKPPLPPRPGNRVASTSSTPASRIPNPFASLFGGGDRSKIVPIVAQTTSSPPASIHSVESSLDSVVVEVPAFTIDRKIVRKDLAKEVNKALKNEVRDALAACAPLGSVPVPGWVAERIQEATAGWFPFVKVAPASPNARRTLVKSGDSPSTKDTWIVNPMEESPEDIAERLQDFYICLEQDMRAGGTPFLPRRRDKERDRENEKERESDAEDEKKRETREQEKLAGEGRIRGVMEAVERTVCTIFYDRLFMQPVSDDASHDEALSSRVAALNMLDLTLEHLDIDVGEAGSEVNTVVNACGEMLTQLEACQNPADKASILVAAHKIVVDGLSRLPPIRIKSEEPADITSQSESREDDEHDAPLNEDDLPTARPTLSPPQSEETNSSTGSVEVFSALSPSTEIPTQPLPPAPVPSSMSDLLSSSPSPDPDALLLASTSADDVVLRGKPPPLLLTPPGNVAASETRLLKVPEPNKPTPVSGDVLLPMIIFSVVKSNPPHLVSHLLFTQRFRNHSVGGEESYCLINMMAVAEFLENVDLAALGLGDSERVLSTADLTPIPLTRSPVTAATPLAPADGLPGSLRGRVEQQVDAIADSANKVISGVVDSSFGILRSFLPSNTPVTPSLESSQVAVAEAPWNATKPGFGLLRRESGFSIASIAASLPITRAKTPNPNSGEEGQQLVTVSRPSSIRSRTGSVASGLRVHVDNEDSSQEDGDDSESGTTGTDDESEGGGDEDDADEVSGEGKAVRSIKSFESMMNATKEKHRDRKGSAPRKSLTDRLAHMSALAGFKGGPSTLQPGHYITGSPTSSRPESPVSIRMAPPIQRFVDCTVDDLKLSEVGELLRDYRRLVEGIRAVGGFIEE